MNSGQSHRRKKGPSTLSPDALLLWVVLTGLVVLAGTVWVGLHLGNLFTDRPQEISLNPFTVMWQLILGQLQWTSEATIALLSVILALAVLAATGWFILRRWRGRRTRVDAASTYMARSQDLGALTHKGASDTAERLGVKDSPGVPIGRAVPSRQSLYGSWEDMHVDIWGPRTGKTTSRAIPAVLAAPGAVLATSNKRDLVDATRDVRADLTGQPVWVFDPQQIALEEPAWWWNPLSYVTDEVKAAQLAQHFASGSRKADARTDAYFDGAGRDLLANLLLAAAVDERPITQVYTWLTDPTDDIAVGILSRAGYPLQADSVAGAVNSPDKQRAGIFGTATQMVSCLTNRSIAPWIVANPDRPETRPHFDPDAFVSSGGTLYSLSKEGQGTAGPLVTALTVAVIDAAERLAAQSPNGRLPVPMLGALDEVANVCRWSDLPDLYSHYGSRGIVLMAILQSWSQGVEVWGQEGMRKLWSAANVKVYGGGVGEVSFLQELSQIIGDHDKNAVSASISRDSYSTTHQLTAQTTMDVADLAALPRGRAVVIPSGAPPVLVETIPWMVGPHAEAVKRSLAAHSAAS